MNGPGIQSPGYFGKVPGHGDFLHHGLDRTFVEPWDRWLSQGIGMSREQLGGNWLDLYLTSPVWRFAAGADISGPTPIAGLFLPSVDAQGRYFPFTIAAVLPKSIRPLAMRSAGEWYGKIEDLARSVLSDSFEIDSLSQALDRLIPPTIPSAGGSDRRFATDDPMTSAVLIHEIGTTIADNYALFWTEGSKAVPASVLLCQQLPDKERFAALIDGRFAHWGWRDGEA